MSASLVVLVPVLLLGLVTTLCFVGCVFHSGGIGVGDQGPYRNPILNATNLIAFWPLDDLPPADASPPVAHDQALHPPGAQPFDGSYTGTFMLEQTAIVTGDLSPGAADANNCASFNGGRVEVPFFQALNPPSFTVECWVQPNWTSDGLQRAVVVSGFTDERPNPTANAGYALIAAGNFWSAQIGIGTKFTGVMSNQPITKGSTYYLAMTFDGNARTLTLFVGVSGTFTPTPPMQLAAGENFLAEQPGMTATSLFIAMGRPDLPTSNEYPFNGSIQDVAIYSPPLGAGDIQKHFMLGIKGA